MQVTLTVGNTTYYLEGELKDSDSNLEIENMHDTFSNLYGQEVTFTYEVNGAKIEKSGRVFFHNREKISIHIS